VIGRLGGANLNNNGELTWQLCCNNTVHVDTFFQPGDMHMCTWCGESLGQLSISIASADLFQSVLDVRVRKGAELSTGQ